MVRRLASHAAAARDVGPLMQFASDVGTNVGYLGEFFEFDGDVGVSTGANGFLAFWEREGANNWKETQHSDLPIALYRGSFLHRRLRDLAARPVWVGGTVFGRIATMKDPTFHDHGAERYASFLGELESGYRTLVEIVKEALDD